MLLEAINHLQPQHVAHVIHGRRNGTREGVPAEVSAANKEESQLPDSKAQSTTRAHEYLRFDPQATLWDRLFEFMLKCECISSHMCLALLRKLLFSM